MNIEQEIKVLRERLDELERQIEKEGNTKTQTRFIPNSKEEYYFLDEMGDIYTSVYAPNSEDLYKVSIGNCFRTEEEVEKHKRILINTQKLKDLAERLNGSEEINWQTITQTKHYIALNTPNMLTVGYTYNDRCLGVVYCLDKNFLDKAKEEIGEEELIELIRGE